MSEGTKNTSGPVVRTLALPSGAGVGLRLPEAVLQGSKKTSRWGLGAALKAIRGKVSKKKIRFQSGDFDLDLTYITPRIIAMGFPSSGTEAMLRNPLPEVQRFFETRHPGRYRIYNLCAERAYDPAHFCGRVARFPFDDHNPCPLSLIYDFCVDIDEWLGVHPDNVVAIHCKAGKVRHFYSHFFLGGGLGLRLVVGEGGSVSPLGWRWGGVVSLFQPLDGGRGMGLCHCASRWIEGAERDCVIITTVGSRARDGVVSLCQPLDRGCGTGLCHYYNRWMEGAERDCVIVPAVGWRARNGTVSSSPPLDGGRGTGVVSRRPLMVVCQCRFGRVRGLSLLVLGRCCRRRLGYGPGRVGLCSASSLVWVALLPRATSPFPPPVSSSSSIPAPLSLPGCVRLGRGARVF